MIILRTIVLLMIVLFSKSIFSQNINSIDFFVSINNIEKKIKVSKIEECPWGYIVKSNKLSLFETENIDSIYINSNDKILLEFEVFLSMNGGHRSYISKDLILNNNQKELLKKNVKPKIFLYLTIIDVDQVKKIYEINLYSEN